MAALSPEQIERYGRQIAIEQIGEAGQQKLLAARVLVVGVGGLGSPCAYYLAAAGVGTVVLVDPDAVELSNLQRQILHGTSDLDRPKVLSAAQKLGDLNPDVALLTKAVRVTRDNVQGLADGCDVVLDCSDKFGTKYLLNDACCLAGRALVHAGISGLAGQMMAIVPEVGPCLRCAFPEPPPPGTVPTPQQAGVLGAVAGVMGAMQAAEAVRLLLEYGPDRRQVVAYDGLTGQVSTLPLDRDLGCPACGDRPSIVDLDADYDALDPR